MKKIAAKKITKTEPRILFWNLTREDIESLMMAGCILLLSIGVCAMGLSLYATATRVIK
jgi:hypothetical protein